MIALTLSEVAAAVGGRLVSPAPDAPEPTVTGPVVTDSRAAGPGSLYVARVGEHADGHAFVPAAAAAGAVAAVVGRELDRAAAGGSWQVVVDDPQRALGALARHLLDRRGPGLTVVAVTGSNGKTSTKDLLAAVLSQAGPTVVAPQSYNSEVGVPLTVLQVEEGTRYLVVEMGARGPGHLTYLAGVAPPDVAVVLNVGLAHAGPFGGLDAVQRAKGELVEALRPGALAVLNADDERVRAMAGRTSAEVVLVGTAADASVRAQDVHLDEEGRARFTLVAPGGTAPVLLRLYGEHQVGNALAAAGVAVNLGMPVADVARALSAAGPASRWRMEVTDRPDGVRVVNDAYNANPDSMRAALRALASMGRRRGRTWAVLGEMLELGEETVARHDSLGRLAVRLNISRLVAVGPGARPIHTGAAQEGSWGRESVWVGDADEAFDLLHDELAPGDVVLVKSSRDAGLRWLGERLAGDSTGGPS